MTTFYIKAAFKVIHFFKFLSYLCFLFVDGLLHFAITVTLFFLARVSVTFQSIV